MKSENGVTLVALITIIIVLIIMMSIGIYSGINSYKVIEFEKYKSQMQMIQNAVDELYEKNKNNELMGKNVEVFGDNKDFSQIEESFWKEEVAGKFGIDISKEGGEYYCVYVEDLEKEFNLEDIDISKYFIINFEKRYVFSVTPIKVISGNDNTEKDIYCLYQLDDGEKFIEFKKITDENFKVNIYKEDYKQIVEITNNINIEKVELVLETVAADGTKSNIYVDINTRRDCCPKVYGLNTKKLTLEIVKNCKIKVKDIYDNSIEIDITLYNVPVLKENMIPIIPVIVENDEIKGKVSYINDPKWYDYYITTNNEEKEIIDEGNTNFAVAINAITSINDTTGFDSDYENYYKKNVADTANTFITIPISENNQSVKVWIPKNLVNQVNNTYGTSYKEEYFEGTGMWVEAFWNGERYVPANGE